MSLKLSKFFKSNQPYQECGICFNNNYPLIDKQCKCAFNICKKCIQSYLQNGCPHCNKSLLCDTSKVSTPPVPSAPQPSTTPVPSAPPSSTSTTPSAVSNNSQSLVMNASLVRQKALERKNDLFNSWCTESFNSIIKQFNIHIKHIIDQGRLDFNYKYTLPLSPSNKKEDYVKLGNKIHNCLTNNGYSNHLQVTYDIMIVECYICIKFTL